jgi:hypothetical protein
MIAATQLPVERGTASAWLYLLIENNRRSRTCPLGKEHGGGTELVDDLMAGDCVAEVRNNVGSVLYVADERV